MTAHEVRARNTDPDTSHAAAADAGSRASTVRARVLAVLTAAPEARDGVTHDHLITLYRSYASRLGWPPASDSGIRTRCNELWKDGDVERLEETRGKSRFRRDAVLWRATSLGGPK
jgi:hypothetical protein